MEVRCPAEEKSIQRFDSGLICDLKMIYSDRNRKLPHKCLPQRHRVKWLQKPIPKTYYCLIEADIRDQLYRQTFLHEMTKTLINQSRRIIDGLSIRTHKPVAFNQAPAHTRQKSRVAAMHLQSREAEIIGYDTDVFHPLAYDSNQARLDWPQGSSPTL